MNHSRRFFREQGEAQAAAQAWGELDRAGTALEIAAARLFDVAHAAHALCDTCPIVNPTYDLVKRIATTADAAHDATQQAIAAWEEAQRT